MRLLRQEKLKLIDEHASRRKTLEEFALWKSVIVEYSTHLIRGVRRLVHSDEISKTSLDICDHEADAVTDKDFILQVCDALSKALNEGSPSVPPDVHEIVAKRRTAEARFVYYFIHCFSHCHSHTLHMVIRLKGTIFILK